MALQLLLPSASLQASCVRSVRCWLASITKRQHPSLPHMCYRRLYLICLCAGTTGGTATAAAQRITSGQLREIGQMLARLTRENAALIKQRDKLEAAAAGATRATAAAEAAAAEREGLLAERAAARAELEVARADYGRAAASIRQLTAERDRLLQQVRSGDRGGLADLKALSCQQRCGLGFLGCRRLCKACAGVTPHSIWALSSCLYQLTLWECLVLAAATHSPAGQHVDH